MIAAINIIFFFSIAYLVSQKEAQEEKRLFWVGFLFKLLAGVAVGLIYQYYYTAGDTFGMFADAKAQSDRFYTQPSAYLDFLMSSGGASWGGYLRASFFVKVISVFSVLTNGNYWITGMWLSFFSFGSSWYLFKTITKTVDGSRFAAALAFLIFPSVVFWGSGLIKESVAMAALLFFAGVWLKCMVKQQPQFWEWCVALFAFWILWSLKYYWVAIFAPVALISLVIRYSGTPAPWKYVGWLVSIFVIVTAVQFIHPNFYPGYFLTVLVANHDAFVGVSDPANLIHYHHLQATWGSIMVNAPWALFSGLFRPLPGDTHGVIGWIPTLENTAILILFVSSINKDRLQNSSHRLIACSVIIYCTALCIFLALSTPNLGSLGRYKVAFLPFFIFLISYRNQLLTWLSRRLK